MCRISCRISEMGDKTLRGVPDAPRDPPPGWVRIPTLQFRAPQCQFNRWTHGQIDLLDRVTGFLVRDNNGRLYRAYTEVAAAISRHALQLHALRPKQAVREAAAIRPRPLQVDFWPFDLESGVRVTCEVGYLCANFSLPMLLCSRLSPDVRDRQTDRQTDRHTPMTTRPCGLRRAGKKQLKIPPFA